MVERDSGERAISKKTVVFTQYIDSPKPDRLTTANIPIEALIL
jgi:hypothetical protein